MISPLSATHLDPADLRRARATLASLQHRASCSKYKLVHQALSLAVNAMTTAITAYDSEQPVPAVPPLELELGEVVG